jgi:hypothetical protein
MRMPSHRPEYSPPARIFRYTCPFWAI